MMHDDPLYACMGLSRYLQITYWTTTRSLRALAGMAGYMCPAITAFLCFGLLPFI